MLPPGDPSPGRGSRRTAAELDELAARFVGFNPGLGIEQINEHLGTTTKQRSVNAIRLVLGMHELLTPQAKYGNAIAGLRSAAKALGHPTWATYVDQEARRSGYPLNP